MIKEFLRKFFKCRHKHAIPYANEGYCPECGCYVKKNYYIVRCKCCGIKRGAKKKYEEISPAEKFCTNCGSSDFVIEKCENLNIVDINYAIEVIETLEDTGKAINELEIWIDETGQKNENTPLLSEMKYITG